MRPFSPLSRIPLATRIAVAIGLGLILAISAAVLLFEHTIREYENRERDHSVALMAEMLHEAIRHAAPPGTAPGDPRAMQEVQDILDKAAAEFGMTFWIDGDGGKRLLQSGEVAGLPLTTIKDIRLGRLTIHKSECASGPCFFIEIPSELAGRPVQVRGLLHRDIRGNSLRDFRYGILAITFLGALLSFPLARRITVPLRKLEESALRIAKGDLSQRVEINSSDEVGRLSAAFNAMADGIARSFGAIRDLNANISHQLRSPLTRIAMLGELARANLEQEKPAEAAGKLQEIQEEIGTLDGLIERILRLSRQDLRDRDDRHSTVDLASLVREHCRRITPLLEAKAARLLVESPDQAMLTGRTEDCDSLVVNLLDNAAKYVTPGGLVSVTVRNGDGHVEFAVHNTCRTFTAGELEAMFEPFRRLDPGAAQGYGLGLTLARGAAGRLGAVIHPSCTRDGLEMRVRLPIRTPRSGDGTGKAL